MLSNLTILIPLAAALGVLVWIVRWADIHRRAAPAGAEAADRGALSPAGGSGRAVTRTDRIAIAVITAVYAVVAFTGLGSTEAPQTFLHYAQGNTYALIELHESQTVSALRYYSGLCTADYLLQFSMDGENWTDQIKEDGTSGMTQQYTQLFRWNDAVLNADRGPTRYIRIISGDEQNLGEVAIYGEDGGLIDPADMTVAAGCEMLVDEQDVIPAAYSYKNGTYFDEIYFPRTALEHIEGMWPYEITHPPLGKVILSLGIRLFGMTPFGWRSMGTLFGVMMLPLFYLLLKRMTGLTAAAAAGTAVFAFDFMHFAQTRLATIDSYVVFFIIAMYLFMYLWLTEPEGSRRRLLWLALAGTSFGLGAASKWTGIYAGAGLGLLWLAYWAERLVRARKTPDAAGTWGALLRNIGWCLIFFVLVPCCIYYVSYWSYAPSQGVDGPFRLFKPGYMRIVLDNQEYMWNYHSDLESTHPYSSKWYQWIFDVRPILYYMENAADGSSVRIASFNSPLVSWAGLAAMVAMGWLAVRDRDRTAGFILVGYLANLLPWVLVSRLTFAYHYFPASVFLALGIGYLFGDLRRHDPRWKASVGSFTAAALALFCVFYPVLAGVSRPEWYAKLFLRWFVDTWPF